MRRLTIAAVCAALVLGACGSDGDDADEANDTPTPAADSSSTTTEGGDSTAEGATDVGGPDDYEPGDVSFRLVHLAPGLGAVDVYAFTSQGLVEEFLLESDVDADTVLDDLHPPADGKLVVFPAGTTDLDVFSNDALVAEASTANSDDNGDARILVIADDEDAADGYSATVYWENPDASLIGGSSNALPAPVDGSGLVVMAAAGDAPSVYPAEPGAGACLAPDAPGSANTAVGGTTVQAFTRPAGTVELALHSFDDQDFDCTAEPVHTVTVDVAAGERVFVLTHAGDDGALDTLQLPLTAP